MAVIQALDELQVDEVDLAALDEAQLREGFALDLEAHAEEGAGTPPPVWEVALATARWKVPWSNPLRLWVRDGGRLVARGVLARDELDTNRHLSHVMVQVTASHRGRGLGLQLLERLVGAAEADARTSLLCETGLDGPGAAFAERCGFRQGSVERLSVLRTERLDRALLEGWVAAAAERASGYELLALDGRMPDEHLAEWIAIEHVMNTAPRDDLDVEDSRLTPERFRAVEALSLELGSVSWRLVARERATGRFVGMTAMRFKRDEPTWAHQHGTCVHPDHRRHGIGRWLKAVNALRLLDERPQVEAIDTWNARSNDAMLGINVAMGFEPARWLVDWQAPTATVRERLAGLQG